MNPPLTRPLTLVGMSGVGKSYWSSLLEKEAGFTWHDCDLQISRRLSEIVQVKDDEQPVLALGQWMGMPWSEDFATREKRYLELEESVTSAELSTAIAHSTERPQVMDTTGSVVYLSNELLERLRERTCVVYLAANADYANRLLERYLAAPKPIVWGSAYHPRDDETHHDALKRCHRDLLRWRDERYRYLAHHVVEAELLESGEQSATAFLYQVSYKMGHM